MFVCVSLSLYVFVSAYVSSVSERKKVLAIAKEKEEEEQPFFTPSIIAISKGAPHGVCVCVLFVGR